MPRLTVSSLFDPFVLLENLAQPKYMADISRFGVDGGDGVGGGGSGALFLGLDMVN